MNKNIGVKNKNFLAERLRIHEKFYPAVVRINLCSLTGGHLYTQGSGFVTDFSVKQVTDFAGLSKLSINENTPVLYLWMQKGAMPIGVDFFVNGGYSVHRTLAGT